MDERGDFRGGEMKEFGSEESAKAFVPRAKASPEKIDRMLNIMRGRVKDKYGRSYTIDPLKSQRAQNWDGVICVALMRVSAASPCPKRLEPR